MPDVEALPHEVESLRLEAQQRRRRWNELMALTEWIAVGTSTGNREPDKSDGDKPPV
jgi:hypothetical protein